MKRLTMTLAATGVALVMWTSPMLADDTPRDSSSDAASSFISDVKNANGLVLRVPINENGEENISKASIRIDLRSTDSGQQSDLRDLWTESKPVDDSTKLDADTPVDSSTWGWYGWGGQGWARPYYYRSYSPSAYYYGRSYTYSPSYYQSYYGGSYGYRYYYYGCGY